MDETEQIHVSEGARTPRVPRKPHPVEQSPWKALFLGVVFLLICNVLFIALCSGVIRVVELLQDTLVYNHLHVLGLGLWQFVYVFPITRYFRKRRMHSFAKGIWIGAILTFVLNAILFAFLMTHPLH